MMAVVALKPLMPKLAYIKRCDVERQRDSAHRTSCSQCTREAAGNACKELGGGEDAFQPCGMCQLEGHAARLAILGGERVQLSSNRAWLPAAGT